MRGLQRLQQRLQESRAWQLTLVLAYGALTLWFGWDVFGSGDGVPSGINAAALIASPFVVLDVTMRLTARALSSRPR
jgi:hypothetical protein